MKKIIYSFLIMMALIPSVVFAKSYDAIDLGTVLKSNDTFKSINGIPDEYYYTSSGILDSNGYIILESNSDYRIDFYRGSFDENGNFVYEDEPCDSEYIYGGYSAHVPEGYDDEEVSFVIKEISNKPVTTNTYVYNNNVINGNMSYYEDTLTINAYEVYDDEASTTINCDKTNVTFGNTVTCSVNFKTNYYLYDVNFKLLSSKFKISNLKTTNFLWTFKDNGDNSFDVVYDGFANSVYEEYEKVEDDYDSFNDFMKQVYNYDVSDEDANKELINYSNGKDVITFDVTYDNVDDLNDIEDVLKVSDFSYSNTFGTINVATLNQDISFSKEESNTETLIDNPKTGIAKYDFLLIPLLVVGILFIRFRSKFTLFANR